MVISLYDIDQNKYPNVYAKDTNDCFYVTCEIKVCFDTLWTESSLSVEQDVAGFLWCIRTGNPRQPPLDIGSHVKGADIVAMSALLPTTMTNMAETIKVVTEARMRDKLKIMVGEASFTDEYARKVGADGDDKDANEAFRLKLPFS